MPISMQIHPTLDRITPSGIYPYVDAISVWLINPLCSADLAWVKSRCGNGNMLVRCRRARFNPEYGQWLRLSQPSLDLLHWLEKRNDVLLNYVELSLDWIFDSEGDREEAFEFADQHFVKRWPGNQRVRYFRSEGKVTRYSALRTAANVSVIYQDLASKVTGEIYCVHFDWRMRGLRTLQNAGISSISDLIRLDHKLFWQPRLLFIDLDPDRLGRMYWNKEKNTNRRGPWINRWKFGEGKYFEYNLDRSMGNIIIRRLTVQGVIDAYGREFDVRGCMSRIVVDRLLP